MQNTPTDMDSTQKEPELDPDRPFRLGRLLMVIAAVTVLLALASAVIDILYLGFER